MDMKITQKKIPWKSYLEGFSKYKYIALVVLIGLVLLFWPTESGTQTEMQKQQTQHTEVVGGQLEQKLEKILSQIDGVGDCSVMLTTAAGRAAAQSGLSGSSDCLQRCRLGFGPAGGCRRSCGFNRAGRRPNFCHQNEIGNRRKTE